MVKSAQESYHVYLASDAAGTGRKRLTNETGDERLAVVLWGVQKGRTLRSHPT